MRHYRPARKSAAKKIVEQSVKVLLNILFPPLCVFCGRGLELTTSGGFRVCSSCTDSLPFVNVRSESNIAVFAFEGKVREAVHGLKFQSRKSYAETFARFMAILIENRYADITFDCLIPIPMTKKKQKSRGYNQAAEMAKYISEHTGIPVSQSVLRKIKETVSQTELTAEERAENVKGVYEVNNGADVNGKTILLIDDVYTTGSTINECANVLKAAGANEVYSATFAATRTE